jgi:hypothetical protein
MSPPVRHFARHYVEMVVAMVLGMAVLWLPTGAALNAAGLSTSDLHDDAPALMLLWMASIMTVPMVAWMRHRGHRWAPCTEMAASMFLPTFGVIGVLAVGLVDDVMVLMTTEHVVMLPSMLVAMLLRRDEYTGHGHRRADSAVAA